MSRENALTFVKECFKDPKVVELLRAHGKPEAEEEELETYVAIGKKVGLDFTAKEIAAVIEEEGWKQHAETEANVAKLEKLPDEELTQITGGKGDPDCKDTYKNRENCWHNDGCDIVYHDYENYICKKIQWCPGGYAL